MRISAAARALGVLVLLCTAATTAHAQHEGDILLEQRQGRLATGLIDEGGELLHGVRVFAATFEDGFTNEPGFDTLEDALPPGALVGFNVRKALRRWDPTEPGFDEIPPERLRIALGPLGPVLTPTDDTATAGFGIRVDPDGHYHHHLGFSLLTPAGDGVYLLELEMWSDAPGLATSEPFWIVFNQNRPEEEHEAALGWALAHLAAACPADLNGNGVVDFADYLEFLNLFDAEDPRVDFTADGVIDFGDYLEFLNLFETPCP